MSLADDGGGPVTKMGPKERPFRVRFDPASRVWVGIEEAIIRAPKGDVAQAQEITSGVSYRSLRRSGVGKEQIQWQIDHRVMAGWVMPGERRAFGVPALDAALYGVSALRHDESPTMVIPASPPLSVPFPFDVGFESEVGRVVVPTYLPARIEGGGRAALVRVSPIRASFVLDPWRSGKPGRSLEIGVGARYDVDAIETAKGAALVHRVAPMTASSLRLRLQTSDGLASLDCRGDVIPHWTSEGTWKLAALGSVHAERILVAINDQPIAAVLDGGYRFSPSTRELGALHDVRVSLGLSFSLGLR